MNWYKIHSNALLDQLKTSENGLSLEEALKRLAEYGPNQLSVHKEPLWKLIVEPFRSVFVAVLGFAAVMSLLSHEPVDAAIVMAIIVINAVIFYSQQYATSKVLRSLKKQALSTVKLVRAGEVRAESSTQIVPGDIVLLSEGERVPADARVLHSDNLQVNESSLTGESVPMRKHASTIVSDKQIYEQHNMVFQGTYVTAGSARVVIVETGTRTEFGKIAQLASSEYTKSPVQAKIDQLIALLIKIIGLVAVAVFLLALARDIPSSEALRFVLSLSVSAVPEGLPVTLTVIIVLGMRRMAKKKALVRSFKAIEDVGLITTIATDKTGTLTKNRLTIVDTWTLDGTTDAVDIARKTLDAKRNLTDPLDLAIADTYHPPAPDKLYPFDLGLRMSGAYSASEKLMYVKGSPEQLLSLAKLSKAQQDQTEQKVAEFASHGYRVIALATVSTDVALESLADVRTMRFIGLIGLADELRKEAAGAIAAARSAGISVRLITGDHHDTAFSIGKSVGIATERSEVVEGLKLPIDDDDLARIVGQKTIFSRILPQDKFRILKALKRTDITAMTGDGVNDAPALTNAHVGFAMGSGSDIAKDAAGIILLDDNFATIVAAIREGRKIYDNIRRILFYLLSTALGKVITMIGALLFGMPLPVTAAQILWINLVTETTMALPLGLEPEEDGVMSRPPRHPKESLLSRTLLIRMALTAFTIAGVSLTIIAILRQRGHSVEYIQTVVFMAVVGAEWVHAFNARGEHASIFSRIKVLNKALVVGFIIAFVLQAFVMFGPLQSVFDIESVPVTTLIAATTSMAGCVIAVVEIHKLLSRKSAKKP